MEVNQLMVILTILTLGSVIPGKCNQSGSRINLGSGQEKFASWQLSGRYLLIDENIFVHDIQEDEYIKGNLLVTVGNALYTVYPEGQHKLIAGSVQSQGFANGYGKNASFNRASGLLQMEDGKVVIISDFYNFCLRKLDRQTNRVSTFAGRCNDYVPGGSRGRLCHRQTDGLSTAAVFCSPAQMRYDHSTDKIYVLDVDQLHTFIRSVDPYTADVSTVFSRYGFNAHNFLIDYEKKKSLVFALAPGIVEWDMSAPTTATTWLTSCGTTSYSKICPNQIHGLLKKNGVYIFTDLVGGEIYIDDLENQQSTTICEVAPYSRCKIRGPTSLALIGDYLYIGDSVKITPDWYMRSTSVEIWKIKLSITPQDTYNKSGAPWLNILSSQTSSESTEQEKDSSPIFIVGGIVVGIGAVAGCLICLKKATNRCAIQADRNGQRRSRVLQNRSRLALPAFRNSEPQSAEGETISPLPYQRLDESQANHIPVQPIQPPPYQRMDDRDEQTAHPVQPPPPYEDTLVVPDSLSLSP